MKASKAFIYGSITTVIANTIFLANTPTSDQKIQHREQNLLSDCIFRCSSGLTERKLPMQRVKRTGTWYIDEVQKITLIISFKSCVILPNFSKHAAPVKEFS